MILQSQRLVLEPLQVDHAEALFDGFSDPALYGFIEPEPPTAFEELRERYLRILAGPRDNPIEKWVNFAVRLQSGEYIGMTETSVFPGDCVYLAYFIFTSYQGKGYAREACVATLNHVRETYHLKRIVVEMDIRNIASWKLVESMGFQRVRTTKDAAFFKGATSDEYYYEHVLNGALT